MEADNRSLGTMIWRVAFWENISAIGIGVGVLMFVQPFVKWAFGAGFVVLLIASIAYVIFSHFPASDGNG